MKEGRGGGVVEGENWFSRWEDDLPTPEELMPLSQSLITPHLALAFDIPTNINNYSSSAAAAAAAFPVPPSTASHHQTPAAAAEFDDLNCSGGSAGGGAGGCGDEPARTLKRPRLVWTPQLHKRFVDAVAHLGIKNAVPKTIMQLMSVDGLTRENVASHLQKYRLYLKRMQGLTSSSSSSAAACSPSDAATDQLFASAPIPHHFLRGVGGGGGGGGGPAAPPEPSFMPFVPAAAALQHHQQMVAAAAAAAVQQQYHQRQMGHFGSPAAGFDHGGFLARGQPPQPGMHRMGPPAPAAAASSYADDLEEGGRGAAGGGGGGRKVLTLFPTGED